MKRRLCSFFVFLVVPVFIFLIFSIVGCQKNDLSQSADIVGQQENPFKPFPIFTTMGARDNHYVPSGFMPDGVCLTVNERWQEDCYSGRTCIKIIYDIDCSRETARWAGVYWQNPAHNWGDRRGGYNLTGATKLTFWARGERGGERIEEFRIGGITGDYPDTDTAFIGPVILSDSWQQYTIDLRGKDLSYISGGFSWTTNVDVNPESCTFYLDHIIYE